MLAALAACSKDGGGDDLCYCPDAGSFDAGGFREDLPPPDLGALGAEDHPDVPVGTEAIALPDVAAADVADVPLDLALPDAIFDAGAADSGTDTGATPELPAVDVVDVTDAGSPDMGFDAGPADAGVDAPGGQPDVVDVVDVPRDTGPVDGGPVVYDLDAVRSGVEYVVLHHVNYGGGTEGDCTAAPTAATCSVSTGTLRFAFRQCGTDFVGTFALSLPGTRALSLSTSGAGNFAPNPVFTAGRRNAGSPARQSFHIQFARAIMGSEPGATGIPGRTVDPTLGDIWLLGCQSE